LFLLPLPKWIICCVKIIPNELDGCFPSTPIFIFSKKRNTKSEKKKNDKSNFIKKENIVTREMYMKAPTRDSTENTASNFSCDMSCHFQIFQKENCSIESIKILVTKVYVAV
jgi:hypothetical protein